MYRRVGHLAEPSADREHEVGVENPRGERLVHRDAEHADVARRAIVDVVLTAEGARDGKRVRLAERLRVAARLGRPAPLADDDERTLGGREKLSQASEVVRARRPARRLDRDTVRDVRLLAEDVLRQRQHDGPGSPGERDRERLCHVLRDPRGAVELPRGLRDATEHPRVIELLPRFPATERAWHLPDEEQHRRGVLLRSVYTDRRLGRARPARDEADAGSARELPVRLGRIRRALLMSAGDEPDRRVVERVEHGEIALAREAERELGTVQLELVDEDPAAGPHRSRGSSESTVARWSRGLSSSAGST